MSPRGTDPFSRRARGRAWAELLRISALFTVPGDALAGAAATGTRPGRATWLALGSSLCLYEAGMALNDWADRDEDAHDRPHRPIPSGRVTPAAALTASAALTAAGLTLAARAGRTPLATATALAATVWSYDLHLKHTRAAPATMATARALDLLLGAAATSPAAMPRALPSAALLAAHTYAVTSLSRHETQGGSTLTPLAAIGTTAAVAWAALTDTYGRRAHSQGSPERTGGPASQGGHGKSRKLPSPTPGHRILTATLASAYLRTTATPFLHAALNPSPPVTQHAVGAGIRALIPLQATLTARTGALATAAGVMAFAPLARALARKVSPT
ncbi:SCO3242 family prenyltransferase [Streptomyces purpureus]|uniref:SCO3242 family prenyltransferase n=1 Tax=Streptomyces purpureus TaxID=1951 RepID=UPI0037ABB09F